MRLAPLRLVPLERAHAEAMVTWRYGAPYDVYDLTGTDPATLLDPAVGFHAVLAGEELVGFRSFGADGRVPGFAYDDPGLAPALDTGGGLRPDLVGRGLGRAVVTAGLAHGRVLFDPPAYRVTVASTNARALRTVTSLGFAPVAEFASAVDARPFTVLLRPEPFGEGSAIPH